MDAEAAVEYGLIDTVLDKRRRRSPKEMKLDRPKWPRLTRYWELRALQTLGT